MEISSTICKRVGRLDMFSARYLVGCVVRLKNQLVTEQRTANMILTRVRPSIWIPAMEVTWVVLTFFLAKCNNAESIYALRFLIGLAESAYYPGMQ